MDIIALLNALAAQIAQLNTALADAQAAAEQIAAEAEIRGYDRGYAEGFAAGAASVVPADPEKKYTQAELDEAVAAAVLAAVQPAVDLAKAEVKAAALQLIAEFKAKEDMDEETLRQSVEAL